MSGEGFGSASLLERRTAACFAEGGPLSRVTEGFVSRPGQTAFACTVARTLENSGTAVIEAGTGTGKTFAYLVPAFLSGRKVIVSTGGKPLQDQLYSKDLPAVMQAFGVRAKTAVLKGRANYICLHRLRTTRTERTLPTRESAGHLKTIEIFAETSSDGERSRIEDVPEDAPIWPMVTSTPENCIGEKCQFHGDCFVVRARAKAKQSDVLVVNHHLFLSAMSVDGDSEEGGEGMLPNADLVIFDEAHKLPEIASNFFGEELSTSTIKSVVHDIRRVTVSRFRSAADWEALCSDVTHLLQNFLLELGQSGLEEGKSHEVSDLKNLGRPVALMKRLAAAMRLLLETAEPVSGMDADLQKGVDALSGLVEGTEHWCELLAGAGPSGGESGDVCWVSRYGPEARFLVTPLSFAADFRALREKHGGEAWVFTSATLSVGGNDFSHFLRELGLEGAHTESWESPFDFSSQAMLYIPRRLPSPKGLDKSVHVDALVREIWPLIDMIGGRTLVLCTSYQAMDLIGGQLRGLIEANGRPYEVFVQREHSRGLLVDLFRSHGHAILVATMSFWEGIDIRGDALSLVIIDKLPFPPRNDPVLKARCRWIDSRGGKSFFDHLVPMAVISLKQGAGRLIRSETDRGILVIGDTRLCAMGYGSLMLKSLPGFTRTRQIGRVVDFWQNPDTWT